MTLSGTGGDHDHMKVAVKEGAQSIKIYKPQSHASRGKAVAGQIQAVVWGGPKPKHPPLPPRVP